MHPLKEIYRAIAGLFNKPHHRPETKPDTDKRPARKSFDEIAAELDALAAESSEDLNWRTSIVDLCKLIGMGESDFAFRRRLAESEGYEGQYTGTPDDNRWLAERVIEHLRDPSDDKKFGW